MPYSTDPAAAAADSEVFVTDGREIRAYDPDGRLRRVIRLAEPDRVVTGGDMAAYGRMQGERTARDSESIGTIAAVYREMPIPAATPRFQRLLIDRTGLLWAELYRTDEETRQDWMVFDEEGRALGTVAMPAGLEVHEIGRDYVLGRWRDDYGVEYVRRHTLHREQESRVRP